VMAFPRGLAARQYGNRVREVDHWLFYLLTLMLRDPSYASHLHQRESTECTTRFVEECRTCLLALCLNRPFAVARVDPWRSENTLTMIRDDSISACVEYLSLFLLQL
jgi:hypothetical protein